ncbi:MAG: response regulator [Deltaproteobacteria bacterium]|nr:response regulator [Deltaproteobacteria bacterium]
MSVSVGVVSRKPQSRRQISRALVSGGLAVEFADDAEGLGALRVSKEVQLVVIDSDLEVAEEIADLIARIRASGPPVPVVLLSLGEHKSALIELFRQRDIVNLVAKHGAVRAVYPVLDERELLVTCKKVTEQDIFGIEKYIGGFGPRLHRETLGAMAEKQPAIARLERYLTSLACPAGVIPDILNVADELMLNAIVHAPRNPDGSGRYEKIGPSPSLMLDPHERVSFSYGCDGQRFILGVSDNFGRLGRETLYQYVAKGFGDEKLAPEDKASGAGLGLTLAFRSIHQLVFNIQANERTECIAGWYLRVSNAKEFRQVGKSFNLFWLPEGARPIAR